MECKKNDALNFDEVRPQGTKLDFIFKKWTFFYLYISITVGNLEFVMI